MRLQIGKLDTRIVIEHYATTTGEYGEPIKAWVSFATVWANKYEGSGRELVGAKQINAEITTQFQIRFMEGLSAKMRIVVDGRYHDIASILEVGRRDRLNIFTKARHE
jgi:SPP1 family predicted phage head-tail adaptor